MGQLYKHFFIMIKGLNAFQRQLSSVHSAGSFSNLQEYSQYIALQRANSPSKNYVFMGVWLTLLLVLIFFSVFHSSLPYASCLNGFTLPHCPIPPGDVVSLLASLPFPFPTFYKRGKRNGCQRERKRKYSKMHSAKSNTCALYFFNVS